MSHPLPVGHRRVSAGWTYSKGGKHAAFDYGTPIGTPVFAVRRGRILKVVDHHDNLHKDTDGLSGTEPNYILQAIMLNGVPATVAYVHISPNALVREGDQVTDGQQICASGHNGHSEGPHLHIHVTKGHASRRPFHNLDGLVNNMPVPPPGLAPNRITYFPPSLAYTTAAPITLADNTVLMRDLQVGVRNSESVRRLQKRLNQFNLPGSVHLSLTGNYLKQTRTEVQRWQMAKFNRPATSPLADGKLRREQAKILFAPAITVR